VLLKRALRSPSMWVGGLMVILVVAFAMLATFIGPEGFDKQDLMMRLKPPSAMFPLGTDHLGRSILTRLAYGGQYSLKVGLIAVAIGASIGIFTGALAGFYGGWVDRVLMGFVDILLAFPGILLAIAIVAALGPGLVNVMIAVGIRGIPTFARLVRGQVLSVRGREYVEAAHAMGSSDGRIIMKHVFPNIMAPIIVLASLDIASAILSVAALNFLGLGAQPPIPDWGGMIDQGRQYLRSAWWMGVFPGLAIMLTVLGFNLLGDALRDLLDPRLKNG
jgi:peptide/nickel transport system permease protein